MSIDARDLSHPQRLAPPRPPAPVIEELPAKLAPGDRRGGLTPITLLLVLVVGYLLLPSVWSGWWGSWWVGGGGGGGAVSE